MWVPTTQLVKAQSNLIASFARAGVIEVSSGVGRFLFPAAANVINVSAAVNTAPTGAAIICDLNKNGVTMFTTQANRPTIADGAFSTGGVVTPDIVAVTAIDYLTVDVDQVGSGVAGSDLVVQVLYRFT